MRVAPPGGFTLSYFRNVHRGVLPPEDISERIYTSDVFRETHRGPKVLTTKEEWAYVWNGISCTCCILFTDDKEIHACDDKVEAIMEKIRKAKENNFPYDLVFIKYEVGKHPAIDELIVETCKISPETKIFLLTFHDDGLAEELRKRGYFTVSGYDMMKQTRYDFLIAGALGEEGIERLEKN